MPDINESLERMQELLVAVQISTSSVGVKRSVDKTRVGEIAKQFDADSKLVSAQRKVIDDSDPAFQKVMLCIRAMKSHWASNTFPSVHDGIRYIERKNIRSFNETHEKLQEELKKSLTELESAYPSIKEKTKARLGQLYDETLLPATISDQFSVVITYPRIEPDKRLLEAGLGEIYEKQAQIFKRDLEHAADLAKQELRKDLAVFMTRLAESLKPTEEGGRRKLHQSTFQGLFDMLKRIKEVEFINDQSLTDLVENTLQIMNGKSIKDISTQEARMSLAEVLDPLVKQAQELATETTSRAVARKFVDIT